MFHKNALVAGKFAKTTPRRCPNYRLHPLRGSLSVTGQPEAPDFKRLGEERFCERLKATIEKLMSTALRFYIFFIVFILLVVITIIHWSLTGELLDQSQRRGNQKKDLTTPESNANKRRANLNHTVSIAQSNSALLSPADVLQDFPVLIMVLSGRNGFDKRAGVRETWAKDKKNVVFLVGDKPCTIPQKYRIEWSCILLSGAVIPVAEQEEYNSSCLKEDADLKEEIAQHGDIVLLDMVDYYRALPKKVKLGYKWAIAHSNAKWIVKTDDDSYVVMSNIERMLGSMNSSRMIVVGHIIYNAGVPRDGKWAEFVEYKEHQYPAFPNGAHGHAVSRNVAKFIVDHDGFEYQGEDVSIGIWLRDGKQPVEWVYSAGFVNDGNCMKKDRSVIGHNISPEGMRKCHT
jgi:hypothetical protein